ncbi:MAG: peptidoglycan-binding protein [Pseudomonadaceae bacterium]|nr:peptidoglycan-binding protein [Pseudomonadaceae bacterium]
MATAFLATALLVVAVPSNAAIPFFGRDKAGTETEVLNSGPVDECQGKRKASVAISRFDNKVRNSDFYRAGVGDAMADQLTTALVSTGCYKVVDRQNLKGVMDEMGLQNSGLVDPSTASRVGKLVGADLIVTAAVTEFKDNSSGRRAGAAGGAGAGGIGGLIGGIAGSRRSAHMAIDLRITDVQTSEIIGATAVKGKATDVKAGAVVGALIPGAAGLGAIEDWENTPRGAALRQVIDKSVTQIYRMIPEGYFRHNVGRFGGPAKAMGGGSSGGGSDMVRKAQQALKDLGIYSGGVDGLMGPNTAGAIREFQSQMGLEETGKLDLKTMKEIRSLTE